MTPMPTETQFISLERVRSAHRVLIAMRNTAEERSREPLPEDWDTHSARIRAAFQGGAEHALGSAILAFEALFPELGQ